MTSLLLASLALGMLTAPIAPDTVRWARDRTIDVQHIDLDLRFDWTRRQAIGSARIRFTPIRPTQTVTLDGVRLDIRSVSLGTGTSAPYQYDSAAHGNNLTVTLDRAYKPGEVLTVQVDYATRWVNQTDPASLSGSFGRGIRFFESTSFEPNKRRQAWSVGEAEGNRYWFPSHDVPNDLRTMDFRATVAQPLSVVASGKRVGVQEHADRSRTFHWRVDVPSSNARMAFAIGEYEDVTQSIDGVTLHSHGYPDEREAVAATIVRLPEMATFFTGLTGVPLPGGSYHQVFVQDFGGAIASAGMSTITENMIDDAPTHEDYRYLWDGVEASALAGQWFGNLVSVRAWKDGWVVGALARHLDAQFTEHRNGVGEHLLWNHLIDQNTYHADWQQGIRRPLVTQVYDDAASMLRDNHATSRGALVLHMLRRQLGDAQWKAALQLFTRRHAHGLVTTDDLRIACEDATGVSLDWFFTQWVHRLGHPVFDVSAVWDSSASQLVMTVRQTQRPDSATASLHAGYFRGSVPVSIDGDTTSVWLEAQAVNTYRFPVRRAPRVVAFDYDNTWIKELTFARSLTELVAQATGDGNVASRRWAMDELVKRTTGDTVPAADRLRADDALRAVAAGQSFWRLRLAAVWMIGARAPQAGVAGRVSLDTATRRVLLGIIREEHSWLRGAAISLLGRTADPQYADVYRDAMREESHPVINAAAIALGRTKRADAYATLVRLMSRLSWKGENRISALNGFRELGDRRAVPLALAALKDLGGAHWMLATSTWDHRLAGAETLAALGAGAEGYSVVRAHFEAAMADGDLNDILVQTLFVNALRDRRGQEIYDRLRARYAGDTEVLRVIEAAEGEFRSLTGGVSGASR